MTNIRLRKYNLRFLNPFKKFFEKRPKGICLSEKNNIIVSVTSYPERFRDLKYVLISIFKQSLLPNRVILWLSDEFKDSVPEFILKFKENGLEIKFVKDIKSYTKIIYTVSEFPEAVIVTADDDVYYPAFWLERLYNSYLKNPEDIQVHRAHRVKTENGKLLPYEKWNKHEAEESARFDNFLTGAGGVLYPPKCFNEEVLKKEIFLKEAPFADDVWLWFMALVNSRKIRIVENHIDTVVCTNIFRQILKKGTLYSQNKNGGNDRQINNLMKIYGKEICGKLF